MSVQSDRGAAGQVSASLWRAYGVALVPLALAGFLPLWACLLMCLVFALGVRWPSWSEARLLGCILVVGLTTALQMRAMLDLPHGQLLGAWSELGPGYLGLLLTTAAVYWVSTRLEFGQRRGLLALLLVGLFAPTPGLLLALAGGALARYSPDDRLSRPPQLQTHRMWATVGLVVAAIILISLALPRERFRTVTTPPAGAGQPTTTPDTVVPRARQVPAGREALPPDEPFTASPLGWVPPFPTELFLVVTLPAVLLIALGVLRFPRRGRRRMRPVEWMVLAALLLNFALLLLLFVPTTRSAVLSMLPGSPPVMGGQEGSAGRVAQSVLRLEAYLNLMMWLAFFFYLGLGALLFYFWRKELDGGLLRGKPGEPEAPEVGPGAPQAALHRVRLAFRAAEELLLTSGRGRLASETPLAYTSRLSARDDVLAAPLGVLASAYEPVRYGGRVSDEDADSAEQAVRELQDKLLALPHLEESVTGHAHGVAWKEET